MEYSIPIQAQATNLSSQHHHVTLTKNLVPSKIVGIDRLKPVVSTSTMVRKKQIMWIKYLNWEGICNLVLLNLKKMNPITFLQLLPYVKRVWDQWTGSFFWGWVEIENNLWGYPTLNIHRVLGELYFCNFHYRKSFTKNESKN